MILRLVLSVLLMTTPAIAHAEWNKATSDHFIIYGQMTGTELRTFTEKVEKFDALLRRRASQAAVGAPNKLIIFVVRDIAGVRQAMGQGARDVAGFYSPSIAGAIAVVPKTAGDGDYDLTSQIVLFHEYAHHFMLQYFATGYPAWFVEGFAEYYSTTEFRKDGTIAIGLPAKHRAAELFLLRNYPLQKMFAADAGKMNSDETASFYGQSWLLTHYLSFDPARKGQLDKYLKAFASGVPAEKAASETFGSVPKLQKDLQKHLTARKMVYQILSDFKFPVQKIEISPLGDADAALMPLFIRFMDGSDSKVEVDNFVVAARIAAKRAPNNPMANEMLAEGELDAERFDAATTANDAVISQRPNDARALLRRARIATAILDADGKYPGGWKAIRALIVKANRLSPDDPFPLSEYFMSFEREGIPPTPLAADGLARALELAPQTSGLRFTLARWLLAGKKVDEARVVLAPILNEPHSAEIREQARALLTPSEPASPQPKKADEVTTPAEKAGG